MDAKDDATLGETNAHSMSSIPFPLQALRGLLLAAAGLMGSVSALLGASPENLLNPPPVEGGGPVVVQAELQLQDINSIDDEPETFEFTGVLALKWKDTRQAFDPQVAGVKEKIYQGDYQFNELAPGWYPQVVLANDCGLYESDAVVLRVQPDGSCTLISTLNAVVETDFSMRLYPFDSQRLEAVFELIGFHRDEVTLEAGKAAEDRKIEVSQWQFRGIETSIRHRNSFAGGLSGESSEYVVGIQMQRDPMFIMRLVGMPLALIVILSWSVFWMDRSSLGDRISVSFVGILTAVAYQIVVGDLLPHVSYITVMHGFLNLSFFIMSATVVINLLVGACDKNGKCELGDLIDRRCRWIFPLAYFGGLAAFAAVAFWIFRPVG